MARSDLCRGKASQINKVQGTMKIEEKKRPSGLNMIFFMDEQDQMTSSRFRKIMKIDTVKKRAFGRGNSPIGRGIS